MDAYQNTPFVAVADADYTMGVTDRHIVYTSLTASTKTVTLCAANAVPAGVKVTVADWAAAASSSMSINISRAGTDTIVNGIAGILGSIAMPGGQAEFVSNGVDKWLYHQSPVAVAVSTTLADLSHSYVPSQLAVKTYVDTPKVTSITSSATWSPVGTNDIFKVTAQAAAATTINNPSGTPAEGHRLIFRIKDNGTARALTWTAGTKYRVSSDGPALPSTTIISKTMYMEFLYNATDDRYDLRSLHNNF